MLDGNEAAARIAHLTSEVIAIYPITPSSTMGELADEWSAKGRKNIWGMVPEVIEMQSEAGAAGAVHGSLQAGALTTTFTASQGLLLKLPNMFKIAGELTPAVFHIAARTLATHALSIFGDHSDVMAARMTGFALLASSSVQEAQDMAMIAHMSTLKARVPFLHFFDGFRTSHEVNKIELLFEEDVRSLIDDELVTAHRERALNPDRPVLHGTAQNPDVFFQAREACNLFYSAVPGIVQESMDRFAKLTGRRYSLFWYSGAPDAERVLVQMGSGVGASREAVDKLVAAGEKVGLLTVRLYRPFDTQAFIAALPRSVRSIAVLDRTKEPGAIGEPLYQDVVTALVEAWPEGTPAPRVIGGRYGLSSKEYTPAMAKAALDELREPKPKRHFTVGIVDDITHLSLKWDPAFETEAAGVTRAVFYGLGADGTVGATKNTVKIIGENTPLHAQGYFVYDSKKSGAITVSHLRFGPKPIESTYLIDRADFVACHQFEFMEKLDVLALARPGATFLLNSPYGPEQVWGKLPREAQEAILAKKLKFYVVDALTVARQAGLAGRINTVTQACFFAISGVLPREDAIAEIKASIRKTYGKRGETVLARNFAAVDASLAALHEVPLPGRADSSLRRAPVVSRAAPDFVQRVTAMMLDGKGDLLPVSATAGRRHLPDRHHAMGKAQHRAGDPDLGRDDLHPVRDLPAGVPARGDPHERLHARGDEARAGRLQGRALGAQGRRRARRHDVQPAGRPRRLHRLRHLRRRLPDAQQDGGQAQGHQHGAQARAPGGRARQLRLLPQPARGAPGDGQHRRPARLAAAPAAVRVFGRLLGLRRDALPEAAVAAVRRPPRDRQCHRLLVDLRRQPAVDAVVAERRRPGPGLGQQPVRGQRRIRPGHAAGARRPARPGADAGARTARRDRRAAGHRAARVTAGQRRADPVAARTRQAAEGDPRRPCASRRPDACWRWPTAWSCAACGSSAATAGPTTSATAASTTCWPRDATSISWCSTPRSTAIPAARPASPRSAARWPSSPPPASLPARRTWA